VLLTPLADAVLSVVAIVALPFENVNGTGTVPDGAPDMEGVGEVEGAELS
jgi:hypothetical protein